MLDRVICVVNNDAITLFELDEAEAYYLYETKEARPARDARIALRDRLLQRMIENRLQLQQAERERIGVDDVEIERADGGHHEEDERQDGARAGAGAPAAGGQRRVDQEARARPDDGRSRAAPAREPSRHRHRGRDRPLPAAEPRQARDRPHLHGAAHPLPPRSQSGRGRLGRRAEARRRPSTRRSSPAASSPSSPASTRRTAPARTAARWARSSAASWRRRSRRPSSISAPARPPPRSARRSGYHLFKLDTKEALTGRRAHAGAEPDPRHPAAREAPGAAQGVAGGDPPARHHRHAAVIRGGARGKIRLTVFRPLWDSDRVESLVPPYQPQ